MEKYNCWLESSLQRVFKHTSPRPKNNLRLNLAQNDKGAFQVCVRGKGYTGKVKKMKLKKSKMTKVNYKEQPFYVANDGNVYDMDGEKPVHVGSYDENEERIIGNSKYASYFIYDEPDESEDEDELFSDEEED